MGHNIHTREYDMRIYWNERARNARSTYEAVCIRGAPFYFNYLMEKLQRDCLARSFKKIRINKKRVLILEIGCGVGRWIDIVKNLASNNSINSEIEYIGIDIAPNMIQKAYEKHPREMFVIASITHMPFRSNVFDISISITVLHHIPYNYKEKAIGEICRVTKYNVMIIEDICENFQKSTLNWFPMPLGLWIQAFHKYGFKVITVWKHKVLQGWILNLMRNKIFDNVFVANTLYIIEKIFYKILPWKLFRGACILFKKPKSIERYY